MNSETLVQLLQQSFHVTLGATASLAETIQDPQKREERFRQFSEDLTKLTEEWSEKGKITEEEARNFVDNLVKQNTGSSDPVSSPNSSEQPRETSVATADSPQQEIEELTSQIADLRSELEQLREEEN